MFKFNFNVDCEAESGNEGLEVESTDPPLEWLPALRHEITNHHLPSSSDVDVVKVTVGTTKIKHLVESCALKKLQEKGNSCNVSSVLQKHTDLVPAVYEGGLTIWECTWDLLQHLAGLDICLKDKRVLELGCGAALPAIYCALHGAHITVQDYNEEVVNFITIPNVAVNLHNSTTEEAATSTDVHLSQTLASRATFYSGDWAAVNQLINQQTCESSRGESITDDVHDEGQKFDLILTSETIYNPSCHKKLLDLMTAHLKQDGIILLAAKTHYFGVGGGTQQFVDLVKAQDQLQVQSITSNNLGVKREILHMNFKIK
ncbi:histidine protein methyltransferase 1 homolog isoform X2 [Portunus trituberculatus]|uniref:histidine protein methyltransferase 1 homolog isoform X2 n=1 Tax=Portunus trituberculatus TaxID=210409 RepID=UPI001E1CE4A9|nr:histidine protein methyltransferase 1 homolog isoform X2 [Portunus trituberculatus]